MLDSTKLLELYVKGDTGNKVGKQLNVSRQRVYKVLETVLRPWHAVMRALNLYYTPKRHLDARDHEYITQVLDLSSKFNSKKDD